MSYIGGMYRVWVSTASNEYARLIDYIKSEQEARAIANAEWAKLDTIAVKITKNGYDSRKRRCANAVAYAAKR